MTAQGDRQRAVFRAARKLLEESRQADATSSPARWWGRLEEQLAWLLNEVDPQPTDDPPGRRES